MGSQALSRWETVQAAELDRVEATHATVGGDGPGRRWRIQHMNDSYIFLLAAHFQLFARNLHTEACTFFVRQIPLGIQTPVQVLLLSGRQLDRANAQPGSLGADFGRLGIDLWSALSRQNALNGRRKEKLEQMNVWRNAIAHQSFPLPPNLQQLAGSTSRTLEHIRGWRSACRSLAREMDRAVSRHLRSQFGRSPW